MSLARIFSRAQVGVQAPEVIVEVHLGNGLPAFISLACLKRQSKSQKIECVAHLKTLSLVFQINE